MKRFTTPSNVKPRILDFTIYHDAPYSTEALYASFWYWNYAVIYPVAKPWLRVWLAQAER